MDTRNGGMPPYSFGRSRPFAQFDLTKFKSPDATPEQMTLLATISNAVQDFLFFGIGSNGPSPAEYAQAAGYLFAGQPNTDDRVIYRMTIDADGKRSLREERLTEEQAQATAFASHYQASGLSLFLPLDRFLIWLEAERDRAQASWLEMQHEVTR